MTAPPARSFRADIQGLRGVAVAAVVAYHAGLPIPGGFVGVDVFFVISGFVIGVGLLAEATTNGTVDLRGFYARRVRRLLPALGVLVAVVAAVCVVVLSPLFPQPYALRTALAASFSSSNLFLWIEGGGYFSPVDEQNPFVHTWSLGVEEQFYLVFPAAVAGSWWLARRLRRDGRRVFLTVTGVAASASLYMSFDLTTAAGPLSAFVPQPERFAFYGPVTRIWEFAAGIFVAAAAGRLATLRHSPLLGAAGAVLVGVAALAFDKQTAFPGVAALIPVTGAALLVAAAHGPVARVLSHRSLVWLGDRSYSWYLWHWPAIVLIPLVVPGLPRAALVAAVVSLIPAALSYRHVEQRFRHRRTPTAARVTAGTGRSGAGPAGRARGGALVVAAFGVAVPVAVSGAALVGSRTNWGLAEHPEIAAPSVSQQHRCYEASTPIDDCTFDGDAAATVMLVGDSHADSISDAVLAAARDNGDGLVIRTALGCPFSTTVVAAFETCRPDQERIAADIADVAPDVLFVANRSSYVVARIDGLADAGAVEGAPSQPALDAWTASLDATYADVADDVGRIISFGVVPHVATQHFDLALPTLLRPDGTRPAENVDHLQQARQPVLDAEVAAAGRAPLEVTYIDPLRELCSDVCDVRDSTGSFRWRDNNHLTPAAAAREFSELFSDALGDGAPAGTGAAGTGAAGTGAAGPP
ncbi:acyltransferase family protein [Ilumatobacter sp.]|uniref:acyltransferase family protein n=1 Tax=Ilumatobacter sp. TaxID=1967498 RepID=UPI003B523241